MLENLRNELLGTEIDFVELDNYMMSEGFYSVFDDGVTDNIKECSNVAYKNKKIKLFEKNTVKKIFDF